MLIIKEFCLIFYSTYNREIFFAIISTTITLIAVFFPIVFLEGMTGRLFREFSIVIAGAVAISSFVALTLTPMLSTKLLRPQRAHGWIYNLTEKFFLKLNSKNTIFSHSRTAALL